MTLEYFSADSALLKRREKMEVLFLLNNCQVLEVRGMGSNGLIDHAEDLARFAGEATLILTDQSSTTDTIRLLALDTAVAKAAGARAIVFRLKKHMPDGTNRLSLRHSNLSPRDWPMAERLETPRPCKRLFFLDSLDLWNHTTFNPELVLAQLPQHRAVWKAVTSALLLPQRGLFCLEEKNRLMRTVAPSTPATATAKAQPDSEPGLPPSGIAGAMPFSSGTFPFSRDFAARPATSKLLPPLVSSTAVSTSTIPVPSAPQNPLNSPLAARPLPGLATFGRPSHSPSTNVARESTLPDLTGPSGIVDVEMKEGAIEKVEQGVRTVALPGVGSSSADAQGYRSESLSLVPPTPSVRHTLSVSPSPRDHQRRRYLLPSPVPAHFPHPSYNAFDHSCSPHLPRSPTRGPSPFSPRDPNTHM